MDKDIKARWEQYLNPEALRSNLILASLYIAAFEILKNSIVERIRWFFFSGFDEKGRMSTLSTYKDEVLSKDRSPTYASLKWLRALEAVSDSDIEKFNKVKELRNLLAHEIANMLMDGLPSDFAERFNDMVALLDKIERWWIVNVDIPTNPSFDGKHDEIDEREIMPGPILGLRVMVDIALGPDEIASYYLDEFKKNTRR